MRQTARPSPPRSPSSLHRLKPLVALLATISVGVPFAALALPSGEQVIAGQVDVSRPTAENLLIRQTSDRAIVEFESFGIGAREKVQVVQPGADSFLMSRIIGADPTQIFGTLQANGRVMLVNPNGVYFAPGATIDVGSMIATTLNISNENFLRNHLLFDETSTAGGVIRNDGTIRASEGGFVALLGSQVINTGTITTPQGTTGLAAGGRVKVDFDRDGLMSFQVDVPAALAKVTHTGIIQADGGRVALEARTRDALQSTVINSEGVIRARGFAQRDGRIFLDGGSKGVVDISGKLDASNPDAGGRGGEIRVLGADVHLTGAAHLDASGAARGGIVLVGGGKQGADATIRNAANTRIAGNVTIDASAVERGDGGTVIVWADGAMNFEGSIAARGGRLGGDGGFVETSGGTSLSVSGRVDVRALDQWRAGTWLLDPSFVKVTCDVSSCLSFETIRTALNQDGNEKPDAFDEPSSVASGAITIGSASGSLTIEVARGQTETINSTAGRDLIFNGAGGVTLSSVGTDTALGLGTLEFTSSGTTNPGRTITILARGGNISLDGNLSAPRIVLNAQGSITGSGTASAGAFVLLAQGSVTANTRQLDSAVASVLTASAAGNVTVTHSGSVTLQRGFDTTSTDPAFSSFNNSATNIFSINATGDISVGANKSRSDEAPQSGLVAQRVELRSSEGSIVRNSVATSGATANNEFVLTAPSIRLTADNGSIAAWTRSDTTVTANAPRGAVLIGQVLGNITLGSIADPSPALPIHNTALTSFAVEATTGSISVAANSTVQGATVNLRTLGTGQAINPALAVGSLVRADVISLVTAAGVINARTESAGTTTSLTAAGSAVTVTHGSGNVSIESFGSVNNSATTTYTLRNVSATGNITSAGIGGTIAAGSVVLEALGAVGVSPTETVKLENAGGIAITASGRSAFLEASAAATLTNSRSTDAGGTFFLRTGGVATVSAAGALQSDNVRLIGSDLTLGSGAIAPVTVATSPEVSFVSSLYLEKTGDGSTFANGAILGVASGITIAKLGLKTVGDIGTAAAPFTLPAAPTTSIEFTGAARNVFVTSATGQNVLLSDFIARSNQVTGDVINEARLIGSDRGIYQLAASGGIARHTPETVGSSPASPVTASNILLDATGSINVATSSGSSAGKTALAARGNSNVSILHVVGNVELTTATSGPTTFANAISGVSAAGTYSLSATDTASGAGSITSATGGMITATSVALNAQSDIGVAASGSTVLKTVKLASPGNIEITASAENVFLEATVASASALATLKNSTSSAETGTFLLSTNGVASATDLGVTNALRSNNVRLIGNQLSLVDGAVTSLVPGSASMSSLYLEKAQSFVTSDSLGVARTVNIAKLGIKTAGDVGERGNGENEVDASALAFLLPGSAGATQLTASGRNVYVATPRTVELADFDPVRDQMLVKVTNEARDPTGTFRVIATLGSTATAAPASILPTTLPNPLADEGAISAAKVVLWARDPDATIGKAPSAYTNEADRTTDLAPVVVKHGSNVELTAGAGSVFIDANVGESNVVQLAGTILDRVDVGNTSNTSDGVYSLRSDGTIRLTGGASSISSNNVRLIGRGVDLVAGSMLPLDSRLPIASLYLEKTAPGSTFQNGTILGVAPGVEIAKLGLKAVGSIGASLDPFILPATTTGSIEFTGSGEDVYVTASNSAPQDILVADFGGLRDMMSRDVGNEATQLNSGEYQLAVPLGSVSSRSVTSEPPSPPPPPEVITASNIILDVRGNIGLTSPLFTATPAGDRDGITALVASAQDVNIKHTGSIHIENGRRFDRTALINEARNPNFGVFSLEVTGSMFRGAETSDAITASNLVLRAGENIGAMTGPRTLGIALRTATPFGDDDGISALTASGQNLNIEHAGSIHIENGSLFGRPALVNEARIPNNGVFALDVSGSMFRGTLTSGTITASNLVLHAGENIGAMTEPRTLGIGLLTATPSDDSDAISALTASGLSVNIEHAGSIYIENGGLFGRSDLVNEARTLNNGVFALDVAGSMFRGAETGGAITASNLVLRAGENIGAMTGPRTLGSGLLTATPSDDSDAISALTASGGNVNIEHAGSIYIEDGSLFDRFALFNWARTQNDGVFALDVTRSMFRGAETGGAIYASNLVLRAGENIGAMTGPRTLGAGLLTVTLFVDDTDGISALTASGQNVNIEHAGSIHIENGSLFGRPALVNEARTLNNGVFALDVTRSMFRGVDTDRPAITASNLVLRAGENIGAMTGPRTLGIGLLTATPSDDSDAISALTASGGNVNIEHAGSIYIENGSLFGRPALVNEARTLNNSVFALDVTRSVFRGAETSGVITASNLVLRAGENIGAMTGPRTLGTALRTATPFDDEDGISALTASGQNVNIEHTASMFIENGSLFGRPLLINGARTPNTGVFALDVTGSMLGGVETSGAITASNLVLRAGENIGEMAGSRTLGIGLLAATPSDDDDGISALTASGQNVNIEHAGSIHIENGSLFGRPALVNEARTLNNGVFALDVSRSMFRGVETDGAAITASNIALNADTDIGSGITLLTATPAGDANATTALSASGQNVNIEHAGSIYIENASLFGRPTLFNEARALNSGLFQLQASDYILRGLETQGRITASNIALRAGVDIGEFRSVSPRGSSAAIESLLTATPSGDIDGTTWISAIAGGGEAGNVYIEHAGDVAVAKVGSVQGNSAGDLYRLDASASGPAPGNIIDGSLRDPTKAVTERSTINAYRIVLRASGGIGTPISMASGTNVDFREVEHSFLASNDFFGNVRENLVNKEDTARVPQYHLKSDAVQQEFLRDFIKTEAGLSLDVSAANTVYVRNSGAGSGDVRVQGGSTSGDVMLVNDARDWRIVDNGIAAGSATSARDQGRGQQIILAATGVSTEGSASLRPSATGRRMAALSFIGPEGTGGNFGTLAAPISVNFLAGSKEATVYFYPGDVGSDVILAGTPDDRDFSVFKGLANLAKTDSSGDTREGVFNGLRLLAWNGVYDQPAIEALLSALGSEVGRLAGSAIQGQSTPTENVFQAVAKGMLVKSGPGEPAAGSQGLAQPPSCDTAGIVGSVIACQ